MRKRGFVRYSCLLVLMMATGVAAPGLARAEPEGNVNFLLGMHWLQDDDWGPLDEQPELGAMMDFGGSDWPIHIAVDVLASGTEEKEDGLDFEATIVQIGLGVRKIWEVDSMRPFAGIGALGVRADAEIEGFDDSDKGFGGWIDGGIFWRIGSAFNVGFAVRYATSEIELSELEEAFPGSGVDDLDAGGFEAGVLLGWGWPAD